MAIATQISLYPLEVMTLLRVAETKIFAINKDDYDHDINYGLTIGDYERGEEVSILNFGVSNPDQLTTRLISDLPEEHRQLLTLMGLPEFFRKH